jgi:hypothetical protein
MFVIAVLITMAGCPTDSGSSGDKSQVDAGIIANILNGGSGDPDDTARAIAEATATQFPPMPSLDTLCQLQVNTTELNAAKKILGMPATESQDSMHASLSYRFQAASDAGAGGAGGAQAHAGSGGGWTDVETNASVSLYMTFDYSDGDVGLGTKIFGIGGTFSDLHKGYIFKDASVEGFPYPSCWPRDEP